MNEDVKQLQCDLLIKKCTFSVLVMFIRICTPPSESSYYSNLLPWVKR